ncbi:ImuA family protein [Sphingomonas sp.]|uniref:ImuA family protein n=1 Tax=Sphingomonas sp. TaxID=28214 RepID=UPI0035AF0FCE
MTDSAALIAHLRHLANASPAEAGEPQAPDAWLVEGLARGQLHEVFAIDGADGACAAGFAVALTLAAGGTPLLWLRNQDTERAAGRLHGPGLIEMGLNPATLVLAVVEDDAALLRAAADAARCPGLATLIVEAWGRMPGYDLTATRRLMLAAETSGVTILALRVDAEPSPTAAATRWGVTPALSARLEADAPGAPAFDVELLRRRGGPAGTRWRVEWNRDTQSFDPAPLSGASLPLGVDRATARMPPAPVRRPR